MQINNHSRYQISLIITFCLLTHMLVAQNSPLIQNAQPSSPRTENTGLKTTTPSQPNPRTNPPARAQEPRTANTSAPPTPAPAVTTTQPTTPPALPSAPNNSQTQPQSANPTPSESLSLSTKKQLIEEGYQVCTTHPNLGVIYCKKAATNQKLSKGQSAYIYRYIDNDGVAMPVDASLVEPMLNKRERSNDLGTNTAPKNSLDEGLVAYYPFNANANDESGHQNNGAVFGAKLTIDRFNRPSAAYKFNGTSDYIMVKNSSTICPEQFTISLWAMLSPTISNNYLRLLSKHIDQPGSYGSYQILTGTMQQPLRCIGTAITTSGYVVSESNTATVAGWHHLLLTWDGANLNLYVDQVLVQQEGWSGTPKYDTNPLYIGKDGFYPNSYFSGVIDDIRIYNRVLKSNEISALFNEN